MNLTKYFDPLADGRQFRPDRHAFAVNLGKYRADQGMRMNFAGDSHDAYSVVIDSRSVCSARHPGQRRVPRRGALAHRIRFGETCAAVSVRNRCRRCSARGKQVFDTTCAGCHASARTGTVIPLAEVGTSAERIGTWNERAAREANQVVAGMGIERPGLVEAPLTGYVAAFLDGIWLRALPAQRLGALLRDLLEPPAQRPTRFGAVMTSMIRTGSASSPTAPRPNPAPGIDVGARGGSNRGHAFRTTLPATDKADLLEYLDDPGDRGPPVSTQGNRTFMS